MGARGPQPLRTCCSCAAQANGPETTRALLLFHRRRWVAQRRGPEPHWWPPPLGSLRRCSTAQPTPGRTPGIQLWREAPCPATGHGCSPWI